MQVKDSLFKHPAMKVLLTNAGNIRSYCGTVDIGISLTNRVAVDRKTKDNQKLFKGTFEGGCDTIPLLGDPLTNSS